MKGLYEKPLQIMPTIPTLTDTSYMGMEETIFGLNKEKLPTLI